MAEGVAYVVLYMSTVYAHGKYVHMFTCMYIMYYKHMETTDKNKH